MEDRQVDETGTSVIERFEPDLAWFLATTAVVCFSLAWLVDRKTHSERFGINAKVLLLAVMLLSVGTWLVSTFDAAGEHDGWMPFFISFNRAVLAMTSIYVLGFAVQRYRRRRVVRGG